jgi:hypothetical protein
MNKTTRDHNAQGMLVFPVWASRVRTLCIMCLLYHLLSRLYLYSSLLLGLKWNFPHFLTEGPIDVETMKIK